MTRNRHCDDGGHDQELRGQDLHRLLIVVQLGSMYHSHLVSWRYSLKHDAGLESLHSEPEYQAIIAEVEADMAAQLVRVRELEANGELAPIPE